MTLRFPRLVECAVQIEGQLVTQMKIAPEDITDSSIASHLETLRVVQVVTNVCSR
jgi:hypothetical protein